MPKIAEKQTVLNGRGSVVRFASGTSVGNYVYREWDNSSRNYRTKHILEAKTMEEAMIKFNTLSIKNYHYDSSQDSNDFLIKGANNELLLRLKSKKISKLNTQWVGKL